MSIADAQVHIDLSICIITFNRPRLLKTCLAALAVCLKGAKCFSYEVVVSDDSVQKSAYSIVSQVDYARWIQGPSCGVASNRNNVAKSALGDWILFIDDDEVPDPDWLNHMYSMIAIDKWDVIEGRVVPTSYPDSILWYAPVINSSGAYCTANLAIRRSLLVSLGGFNENYNVSHEDVELGKRILLSGARSLYLDKAIVFHPARRSTLFKVFTRFINLQCQSYRCFARPPYTLSLSQLANLLSFCSKYWFRATRIEFSRRHDGHCFRPALVSLILFITIPLSSLKLLLMHISRSDI